MIKSKTDLIRFLEMDKIALGKNRKRPKHFDYVWKFEIALRKYEYYVNCSSKSTFIGSALFKLYWKYKYVKLSNICGFSIPINCFDAGLSISHPGTIVINEAARIGENCRLHVCTNIGTKAGISGLAPTIGNNCYIGPGAKLFGPIVIGNNIAVGANAVVNKSFEMDNVSIAGVPARIISQKGSKDLLNLINSDN